MTGGNHRDSLYVFLQRDDVEPTSNSSERDLRPSVIHREGIGSFRSDWGAEASAIRASILATARKQGQNLLHAFRTLAGLSPLQREIKPWVQRELTGDIREVGAFRRERRTATDTAPKE